MNSYPKHYISYLIYFHTHRDFFECHEVLEEYWKEHPSSELSKAWVGLIQVAVSLYHHRRNNYKGARKMMESALSNLSEKELVTLGIDASLFIPLLIDRKKLLIDQPEAPYSDVNIPLNDKKLLEYCLSYCQEHQLQWGQPSDLANEQIVHRHKLRDRSEVISTRLSEKARKQQLKALQK